MSNNKLIIDSASITKRCLFAGKDEENGIVVEHNGKPVLVNSADYGYDNTVNALASALEKLNMTPADMLFVVERGNPKTRRQQIWEGYKAKRDGKYPAETKGVIAEVEKRVIDAFQQLGAQVCFQQSVEADDVIGYLVDKLGGLKVIMSEDGDLARLIRPDVVMWRNSEMLAKNPYGPFDPKFITLYKSLVGDGDEYPGAKGFGEKAWLDLLVNFGNNLAALEGMVRRKVLHELVDDVAFFKPFQKLIDGADMVYTSYKLAELHPEWVNTPSLPLQWFVVEGTGVAEDYRLKKWEGGRAAKPFEVEVTGQSFERKNHAVIDTEIIGKHHPVFLACIRVKETGERMAFWHHREGDMERMRDTLLRDDLVFVSFNGINFDSPIISAALAGKSPKVLKDIAQAIIVDEVKHWNIPDMFGFEMFKFDHIDLCEVAPGVRISLKTYAGRMSYPTMVDMPIDHDTDPTEEQLQIIEDYCFNDLGVTMALLDSLSSEIDLRYEMSNEYGIDLRSKSDAQIAEAIFKKVLKIGKSAADKPRRVRYKAPAFIQTDSPVILDMIEKLEACEFRINPMNGQVEAPDFLEPVVRLGHGTYQMGVGGLHSTHDRRLYRVAGAGRRLSDFDAGSYYPNIMINAGIIPTLGGKGQQFVEEYRKILARRIEAKRSGNKKVANSLKITLNGTFGKLGSMYAVIYAPELMLAVTLTGQLNLMCLIHDLEKIPGVIVLSANTDGIMIDYPDEARDAVLRTVQANALRTGFEYEETAYCKVAMKDVNNYFAVTAETDVAEVITGDDIKFGKSKFGKVKTKGLYAELGLMKNPTMQVCSYMARDYLVEGIHPCQSISRYKEMKDFVEIRNVKGGGVQYDSVSLVDDWVLVNDLGSKDNEWARQAWFDAGLSPDFESGTGTGVPANSRKPVFRKSKPPAVEVGIGGTPFGRVARWYMSTADLAPIVYVGSGNKVAGTAGGRICMTLPEELPADLDKGWYIKEALRILSDVGVEVDE